MNTAARPDPELTRLLNQLTGLTSPDATVWGRVVDGLRRIAGGLMRGQPAHHPLSATALVNEAYLRLVNQRCEWHTRGHFFRVAAEAMRRVLADEAKKRRTLKRNEGQTLPLDGLYDSIEAHIGRSYLDLERALENLADVDKEACDVIHQEFFLGRTQQQVAEDLGLPLARVRSKSEKGRRLLNRYLS